MRNFLLGMIVGVILGATGVYARIKDSVKENVTKENIKAVGNASKEYAKDIADIFDEE